MATFTLSKNDKGYRFALNTENGKVIANSEIYNSIASAQNGIASIKTNASHREQFQIAQQSGKYFFTLKARNHQPIAHSPQYRNEAEAVAGIELLQQDAPNASIVDNT